MGKRVERKIGLSFSPLTSGILKNPHFLPGY
jgi:hypothetical protein